MILTCKQLVKRVTDAREGRLSALDRAGYRLHLMRCRHCRTYVAQMDAIVDAMSGPPPRHDGSAELHAALARLMHHGRPQRDERARCMYPRQAARRS
jgi:anti-sigma factor RsiW